MKGFDFDTVIEFERTNLALGKGIQDPTAFLDAIQQKEAQLNQLQKELDRETDANEALQDANGRLSDALESVLDLVDEILLVGDGGVPLTLDKTQQKVYDRAKIVRNQS